VGPSAHVDMHRSGIATAEEDQRAMGNRTVARQRHLWAVANDGRAGISVGSRKHQLMIPGIRHKTADPTNQVCINHVMVTDQKMGDTIQHDSAVDGFGAGTVPALPISALLQNYAAAI